MAKETDMKKKIIAILLAGLTVFSSGCSANFNVNTGQNSERTDELSTVDPEEENEPEAPAGEDEEETVEYIGGITVTYPEEFVRAKGLYDANSYELDDGLGIYATEFYYRGVTEEWVEKALLDVEEPSEEDMNKYSKSLALFTYVLMINGNRGVDEIIDELNSYDNEEDVTKDQFTEIKKEGECTFFRFTGYDKNGAEDLDDEFAKEFETLYGKFDEILKNAQYFTPVDPFDDIVGKKVEFTTTDMDGNEVKSEELFSQNEVTMVNVWATWCHWCVEELPELNEINERLAKKGCAVVGIVGDGQSEEMIEEARQILKENGDEYLNLLPWDGALTDDLPMDKGWPTTFFIDKEGKMAAKPICGAAVDRYEEVVDQILEGKEPDVSTDDQSAVAANDVTQYRVYVSDTDGNLIEGVMVLLCDDDTCRAQTTDKSGLAVFKVEKGEYKVHIQKQPEGYKEDTQEYTVPAQYSDLHIVLEKE